MTDISSTREDTILDNIKSGGVYVSLHTADEGNEPDGGDEVPTADYSREHLPEADINVSGSAPTTLENTAEINWGTTSNSWGTVTHAALWSDTSGNNGDPYTATVQVGNSGSIPAGAEVRIDSNDLVFEVD
jgi:hypothetical protein